MINFYASVRTKIKLRKNVRKDKKLSPKLIKNNFIINNCLKSLTIVPAS